MHKLTRLLPCRALHSYIWSKTDIFSGGLNVQCHKSLRHCAYDNSLFPSNYGTVTLKTFHTSTIVRNKKIDKSRVPVLDENDLEESFVRGSGPGGQSVNRTSSACHLKHIPTGFVVKCHEARSLERNRTKARLLMIEKLDALHNGDMSVAAQTQRLKEEKAVKAKQKSRKRERMKHMWKEREGID